MAVRFCLVPIETSTLDAGAGTSRRGPKYFSYKGDPDPPALLAGVAWEMRDFGLEPTALLAADVTAGQATTLAAQPDVILVPANLDLTLGANLATVKASLDAVNLPSDLLASGTTYRQTLRGIMAMLALAQRVYGRAGAGGRLFPSGVTLATPLSALSANARAALAGAADDLGYDRTSVVVTSTMRDVLKNVASQPTPSAMLGVAV